MNDRQKGRVGLILLAIASLLLACCLLASLATNGGLAIWALWTRQQEEQAQARAEALETEVQRLRQLLEESGVEIPLSPADEQLMNTVEQQVTGLRGLQPLQPVERSLMTQAQLVEETMQDFEEDFSPEEARDYALTLAAFDMLDPDADVYHLLLRLYTEQIGGYYDTETEEINVIADLGIMGQMDRLTYAHEFTHALQDQHFDLEALGIREDADEEFDSEYLAAFRALIEGDTSLLERQFLSAHYSQDDLMALMEEAQEIDTSVLDVTPEILVNQLMFPYEYGLIFVETLYAEGGWAAVDEAYADPPSSMEQILHPERYRAGDAPQIVSLPPLTDTLGTGWRQADEDIVGEYFLRLYLAQQIPEEDAETAAEGWGGDRYAVHYRESDDALLLAIHAVWDTPADAAEFVAAYTAFAEARFDHAADVTGDGQLCWTGTGEVLCLTWDLSTATIVLGPDQSIVEAVLEQLEARF